VGEGEAMLLGAGDAVPVRAELSDELPIISASMQLMKISSCHSVLHAA